jgi:hypothetical protein
LNRLNPRRRSRGSQTIAAITATAINVVVRARNRRTPRSKPAALFDATDVAAVTRLSDVGVGCVRMTALYGCGGVPTVPIRCCGAGSERVVDLGPAGEGGAWARSVLSFAWRPSGNEFGLSANANRDATVNFGEVDPVRCAQPNSDDPSSAIVIVTAQGQQ